MEALDPQDELWPIYLLVVDDEPLLRSLLAEELRDAGFNVVEAANADEALAYLQVNPRIDLVFTDVHMPGSMNGVDLAGTLKAGNAFLPLIITSGLAASEDVDGLGTFIPKPYKMADAVSLVFKTLGVKPPSKSVDGD